MTCTWLIEVPSGNPEPDCRADLWTEVECGAPIVDDGHGSYHCDNGHEHISYADPRREGWETEQAFRERWDDEHEWRF